MNTNERAKAEQIIRDFPSWTRPMSTEESELVDRYHEYRMMMAQVESDDNRNFWDIKSA